MQDQKRFEVRSGIKNFERHNAILQASYDTIDRMAAIFGDLTFGELLSLPFNEWIPRIAPNVQLAAQYGLVSLPDEVVELFDRIIAAHGEESFRSMAEYMSSEDARLSREIYSPVYKLWFYHGIRLPEFCRIPEENQKVAQCMDAVLEHAGDFNYTTFYTTPRSKDFKTANIVLRQAAEVFIIYLPPTNGMCCVCNGQTGTCQCAVGRSTDWCAKYPGQPYCANYSDTCLGNV